MSTVEKGDVSMCKDKLNFTNGLSNLSDNFKSLAVPMYLCYFTVNTWKRFVLILKHVLTLSAVTYKSKIIAKKMEEGCCNNVDVDLDPRHKGFEWCKDSLGGTWATLSEKDIEITQISGGLTNLLYLCTIPSHINVCDNEPRRVLLRIYGEIAKTSKEFLLKNSVIFALLSEKKLGPKLYCMHPEGRLEEYIPTRCLSRNEIQLSDISLKVATKLALFHSLEMPLCKEPRMLKDIMKDWLVKVENILQKGDKQNDALINKLLSYNLREELDKLLDILSKVNSPVRFCHNDLQEGNLLYLRDEIPERQLTAIDWEYCGYNFRGFDFGNHFCEWCFDYQTAPEYPYYSYHPEDYPSRENQYEFFKKYLNASGTSYVTDKILQDLYREANTFALASHFFWGLWSVVQGEISDIEFGFMDYAVCRLDAYFRWKPVVSSILND
ncbi:hypothetical protein KUTeg_022894 [Tegillarca granosa]|uniref:Choline/ethanolamine kinase n=1 Tax=Tegillarca granosa TaxID=220873 RepID=A0ABQ9E016_TEGGR|nr:hypothetical protein KUTeg_022894 [Tegillarca granosa]